MNTVIENTLSSSAVMPADLKLPRYPKIVEALDQEIRKKSDIRTISELITKDPAMSQLVLRIINSPLFGMSNPIASVEHAVSLLGADKIRTLVLTPNLKQALIMDTEVSEHLWLYSVLNALCSSKLSVAVDGLTRDEAYVAGMFQNSGSMILHRNYQDYEDVFISACSHHCPIYIEELKHYGISNIFISNAMAKKWILPDAVSSALLFQNEMNYSAVASSEVRGLIALMTISNQIVNEFLESYQGKFMMPDVGDYELALNELMFSKSLSEDLSDDIKADLHDEMDNINTM